MNKRLLEFILKLNKPIPVTNGIYYSRISGRFFEATQKSKNVHIRYCDRSRVIRKLKPLMFRLQELEYYELLIPYERQ